MLALVVSGRKSVLVQLAFLPLFHRLVEERVGERRHFLGTPLPVPLPACAGRGDSNRHLFARTLPKTFALVVSARFEPFRPVSTCFDQKKGYSPNPELLAVFRPILTVSDRF
jgi:hypothetical protein